MNIEHLKIAYRLSKIERKEYTTADLADIIIRGIAGYEPEQKEEIEEKIAGYIYSQVEA